MKLDWDVVRDVLTDIEALSASERMDTKIEAGFYDDSPEADKGRHALLLHRAGFISAEVADDLEKEAIILPNLTWEGHQLLATLRSKDVWERIKRTAKEKGLALSFDLVKVGGKMALEQILRGSSADGSITA
jgi:hypothetical protein